MQSPGLLTTVQDLGRPGFGPIGVSASGAADPTALRIANRLVGNPENAAGLEMTLQGGHFLFPEGGMIALGGADFAGSCEDVGLAPWTSYEVGRGQVVRCGRSKGSARCYLSVRGGIGVPMILGSASTDVVAGLGGVEGRPLRRDDVLEIGAIPAANPHRTLHPDLWTLLRPRELFRVTGGPQAGWFTGESVATFYSSVYSVSAEANRMGLRLEGPALATTIATEMISEGVSLGCIQVPANGQPVILFVEQQTTGGYPKIANVIAADLPALGQLKPGDRIRFRQVDLREARELLYIQERWIASPGAYL